MLRPMHVALIVPAPFDTVSGGYEYDRRIVAGLEAQGHTVSVVALPGRHPLPDATARDAACAAMDRLPAGSRCVIDGLALPAFEGLDDALAARGAIGLIHHPTAAETGLDADLRGRQHALERRLFGRLRRLIVTSEHTGESLAAGFGVDPTRIDIVVPGTDDAPRSAGSGGAGCAILSVGTLIPRKGHDVLLRALTEELGLTRQVRFAGALDPAALDPLWRGADLFALATHHEGYGMAIAEALKRGLPVAVTAGGAAAALVGPEAGVVCQPADQEQISKAMRRLVFSRTLRQEMGEAAWQTGRALPNWTQQVDRFATAVAA